MVEKSLTIPRKEVDSEPDLFTQLFRQGLALAQQFSGHQWTDFNLHDPGVTILEQLCFVLTDLIYRSDFEMADYLTQPNGHIDYAAAGLALPDAILPPAPVHPEDFAHLISQALPEVDSVSMTPNADTSLLTGLYQLQLRLNHEYYHAGGLDAFRLDKLVSNVEHCFQQYRLLSTDLTRIALIHDYEVTLSADIDIDNVSDPVNLLANLYFQIGNWLRQMSQGRSLKDLTTLVTEQPGLRALLNAQPGIRLSSKNRIHLQLKETSGLSATVQSSLPKQAWLTIPRQLSPKHDVSLQYNNHPLDLDISNFELIYQRFLHTHGLVTTTSRPAPDISSLPHGEYRELADYQSVQTLFPKNYGLNSRDFAYDPPQLKVKHQQLRGYLLLFDQVMANYCSDIATFRQLFSLDLDARQSYQFHLLDDAEFFDAHHYYTAVANERYQQLQAQFDDYPQRKNRVFDYLLALYGETFSEDLFQWFELYGDANGRAQFTLTYKQRFLQQIAQLTRCRAQGYDTLTPMNQTDNHGGYTQRIELLTGMADPQAQWPYSAGITRYGLTLSEAIPAEEMLTDQPDSDSRVTAPTTPLPPPTEAIISQWLNQLPPLKNKVLPQSLLQQGINLSRYRIQASHGQFDARFDMGNPTNKEAAHRWLLLGSWPTRAAATTFIHQFRQWLITMNLHCERLYVVEHLLLRPRHQTALSPHYAYEISVILPKFTARGNNPAFRKAVDTVITANTPAHILAHRLWLPFQAFCEFEGHYLHWLSLPKDVNQEESAILALDQAATQLFDFLDRAHNAPPAQPGGHQ